MKRPPPPKKKMQNSIKLQKPKNFYRDTKISDTLFDQKSNSNPLGVIKDYAQWDGQTEKKYIATTKMIWPNWSNILLEN